MLDINEIMKILPHIMLFSLQRFHMLLIDERSR
jgi:hypothetical protein